MKKHYLGAVIAASMLVNGTVFAEAASTNAVAATELAEATFWTDKPRAYFGVGSYDHDFEDIVLDDKQVSTDNGFGMSVGLIKPLSSNIDLDWSLNLGSSKGDDFGSGLCRTSGGGTVSCDIESSSLSISMPIVANLRHDVSNDFALHVGAGGALNYIMRSLEYTASGYQSEDIDEEKAASFSPYVQVGLMYKRVRLNYALNIGASGDDTGEGDINSISLEYFFGN